MLTSVSGFTVHPLPSQWEKTCGDLRAWLERNRTPEGWKYPSKNAKDVEEKRLGIWLDHHCRWEKAQENIQRGNEVEMRRRHLEALPGWESRTPDKRRKETRKCAGVCQREVAKEMFTDTQWEQGTRGKCIDCCGGQGRPSKATQVCKGSCGKTLSQEHFAVRQWHRNEQSANGALPKRGREARRGNHRKNRWENSRVRGRKQ